MLESVSFEDIASDRALVAQWWDLAERECASFFASPNWVLAWWTTFQPETRCGIGFEAKRLSALIALARERQPAGEQLWGPALVPLGYGRNGYADHVGWAFLPLARRAASDWLRMCLETEVGKLFRLDPLAGSPVVPAGFRLTRSAPVPHAWLSPTFEQRWSKRFRNRVLGGIKALEDAGVELRWLAARELGATTVYDLHRLHKARCADAGRNSGLLDEDLELLRATLDVAASRGQSDAGPRALVARDDGEIVGMLFGFQWSRTFAFYQLGWHPRYASRSLGVSLVGYAMRTLRTEGLADFDFLSDPEPYKYRFGAVDAFDLSFVA